jgi:hypothetical protein
MHFGTRLIISPCPPLLPLCPPLLPPPPACCAMPCPCRDVAAAAISSRLSNFAGAKELLCSKFATSLESDSRRSQQERRWTHAWVEHWSPTHAWGRAPLPRSISGEGRPPHPAAPTSVKKSRQPSPGFLPLSLFNDATTAALLVHMEAPTFCWVDLK